MKKQLLTLTVLFFFFGFIPSAFCADVAKIGILNFQKILTDSSAGKITQKQLSQKGTELQTLLKTEKDQLDEMKKAFEREALVLSPDKQNEKQRDFRIRVNDFKKMQEDFAREFKQLEVKLLNKIQTEVFQIAAEIGKKDGYLLILEKKAGGVIYNPDQIDITDKIIKSYNLKVSETN